MPRQRYGFKNLKIQDVGFALLWLFISFVPWEEELPVRPDVAFSHFVGAATAVVGLFICFRTGRMRRIQTMHWIAGALVFWAALSCLWSIAPELTTSRVASYVQLLFMVWLIWEFAPSAEKQTSLIRSYVLGTWVAALSTIYNFATGSGTNIGVEQGRYTAGGTNENELGIILALGMAMACYLMANSDRYKFLWLISVPTFFLAILLTGSRGSFLSSLVAFTLFPLSLGRFTNRFKLTAAGCLVVLLAAGAYMIPPAALDRVRSIPEELSSGTLTKRTYIWSAGLDAFGHYPLAGVGAGAFEASVYKQLDIAYVAHNSYLSVLVELGVIGFTIFAALLTSLLYAAWSLPQPARSAWIVLLLTWGVAVSSVTWEHRKPTWFLFGLLMAQFASLRKARSHRVVHAPARFQTAYHRPSLTVVG